MKSSQEKFVNDPVCPRCGGLRKGWMPHSTQRRCACHDAPNPLAILSEQLNRIEAKQDQILELLESLADEP